MDLWDVPVVDVRRLLTLERSDLLALLEPLGVVERALPTAAPDWTVNDVALHLLDDDLGCLSRGRDHDARSRLDMSDHKAFVRSLAAKNQRWIDGAQGLSWPVIIDLLRWSGSQMDSYYASQDLLAQGRVSWASDQPVPNWFDIAQDLTERWVHQQQIREAVGSKSVLRPEILRAVLETFIWALPHQYRVEAAPGMIVEVRITDVGVWHLMAAGGGIWFLNTQTAGLPAAALEIAADQAWRWFTGAEFDRNLLRCDGDTALLTPLFAVRGIIA